MTWGRYTFRALIAVEAADYNEARRAINEALDEAFGVYQYELDDEPWHGADHG